MTKRSASWEETHDLLLQEPLEVSNISKTTKKSEKQGKEKKIPEDPWAPAQLCWATAQGPTRRKFFKSYKNKKNVKNKKIKHSPITHDLFPYYPIFLTLKPTPNQILT